MRNFTWLESLLASRFAAVTLAIMGVVVGSVAYFKMRSALDTTKPIVIVDRRDESIIEREKRLKEASTLISEKKWRAAEEILLLLSVEDPKNSVVFSNLAYTQKKAKHFENAKMNLQRALTLEPGQWILHHNLGMLHFEEGNTKAAIESFGRALELSPHNSQIFLSLARAQELTGKFSDARISYGKAIAEGPDSGTKDLISNRLRKLDVLAYIERGDK